MHLKEQIKLWHRAWKYRYRTDQNEIAYLLQKIKKGAVVFDIGAHKGGYTYWMEKATGAGGKVIAFEPQKSGASLLKKIFTQKNVLIESFALSDVNGSSELYIEPQRFDVSFEASLHNKYKGSVKEKVNTITLDTYCKEKKLQPHFIKIDVEGHELNVIKGAKNILGECKPYLLIESEARHTSDEMVQELFQQLQQLGYNGFFYWENKIQSLDQFIMHLHQDLKNTDGKNYINNFIFEAK